MFLETRYFSADVVHLYEVKVTERKQVKQVIADDNDVESIEWVTLEGFVDLVNGGTIVDAKTLMAFDYFSK